MRSRGAILFATLWLGASPAAASETRVRLTGIARSDGKLLVTVGAQDLIQPAQAARLTSGFGTRVLLRVRLFRIGESQPIAQVTRLSEIVYDLWDERFHLRSIDGQGRQEARQAAGAAEAIDFATALRAFPVADLSRLVPRASYRLNVVADLNPLSEEVQQDVRKWLSRRAGQGRSGGGADGFFGSVVSVFANPRVEQSERRVQFNSQTFWGLPR